MIDQYKRNSCFTLIKDYDVFFAKDNDFIEITEWHNGEGFDLHIEDERGKSHLSLTWGQWKAIKALKKKLCSD